MPAHGRVHKWHISAIRSGNGHTPDPGKSPEAPTEFSTRGTQTRLGVVVTADTYHLLPDSSMIEGQVKLPDTYPPVNPDTELLHIFRQLSLGMGIKILYIYLGQFRKLRRMAGTEMNRTCTLNGRSMYNIYPPPGPHVDNPQIIFNKGNNSAQRRP